MGNLGWEKEVFESLLFRKYSFQWVKVQRSAKEFLWNLSVLCIDFPLSYNFVSVHAFPLLLSCFTHRSLSRQVQGGTQLWLDQASQWATKVWQQTFCFQQMSVTRLTFQQVVGAILSWRSVLQNLSKFQNELSICATQTVASFSKHVQ